MKRIAIKLKKLFYSTQIIPPQIPQIHKTTLQYVSDVHLERRESFPKIPVHSKNIALIGDIGNPFKENYSDFLKYTSDNFERVFLIAGNHEYWHHGNSHNKVNDKILTIANKSSNVEFLNNSQTSLDNYIIFGGTLWASHSYFPYNIYHKNCVAWLEKMLQNHKDNVKTEENNIIILTHYLPSYKLIVPKYKQACYDGIRNKYASDLDYLITKPISFWLCGHSHCNFQLSINGVNCAINAFGYPNELEEENTKINVIVL